MGVPTRGVSDDGSAVVEFVLVGSLLVLLALGVVQLALALHVRNTLTDAAAEGARYASLADASADAGAERTRELAAEALGRGYPVEAQGEETSELGYPAVRVIVRAPLPVLGLVGPAGTLVLDGHAAREPRLG